MRKQPHSVDIRGKMILLGTGTSVGVPALGCGCPVCTGGNPRNQRSRCSAILGLEQGNLLIDTSPDLRTQLLREGIGIVHSVLYTHEHADHIFGLDDLRLFQFYLGHPVPVYCEDVVERRLRKSFDYAFSDESETHRGATPSLEFNRIAPYRDFAVLEQSIQPLLLNHGPRFDVLGFRFGDVAYCTDAKTIPEESLQSLTGLRVLVLGALRQDPHATHMSIDEAVQYIELLKPEMAYLTHCSCRVDYDETNRLLPDNVRVAYDGLQIDLPLN